MENVKQKKKRKKKNNINPEMPVAHKCNFIL